MDCVFLQGLLEFYRCFLKSDKRLCCVSADQFFTELRTKPRTIMINT